MKKISIFKRLFIAVLALTMISGSLSVVEASEETDNIQTNDENEEIIAEIGLYDPTGISLYDTFYGNAGSIVVTQAGGGIMYKVRLKATTVASFSGSLNGYGTDQSNTGYNFHKKLTVPENVISVAFPKGNSSFSVTGVAIGADGKTYKTVPNSIHVYR